MKTARYNYEWKTAEEIIVNRLRKRNFRGWGETTLDDISDNAKPTDYAQAHELWLKLREAFNKEAATYQADAYDSELGSIGATEEREVLRSAWWNVLDGGSYGDHDTLTRIIEALHDGEKLETGVILFGN